MRLFAAIDVTDDARLAIAALQKRLKAATADNARLKLVRADQLHLTLVFIGEVDEGRGRAIVECMTMAIDQDPFEMVFDGIGVFPAGGAPHILWLGVTAGTEAAVRLQREVADRLEELGVSRERRPYSPHLTLARWREGTRSDARRLLAEPVGLVARVPVRAVTLYQSQLSAAGPTYVALSHAPLVRPSVQRDM